MLAHMNRMQNLFKVVEEFIFMLTVLVHNVILKMHVISSHIRNEIALITE